MLFGKFLWQKVREVEYQTNEQYKFFLKNNFRGKKGSYFFIYN
jgi:hypothetical protein